MDELLQKADTLYVTLPSATVSAIAEIPTELAAAVTAGDIPALNALFKRRDGNESSTSKRRSRWKNNSDSGKQKRSLSNATPIGHHRYML